MAVEAFLLALSVGFLVQGYKGFSEFFRTRHWNLRRFVETGGMPSSHAASVAALSTEVGIRQGVTSILFGVTLYFSLVVMYDAAGLRRAAGRHAMVLNRMIDFARLGQLQLSSGEEFGADYFAKYHNRFIGTSRNNQVFSNNDPNIPLRNGSDGGAGIVDPSNLINFSRIIRNVGAGTNIYVAAGDAFAAIVHLLESTGKFKIISRPTVFTSNNKKAIIASGQEVPVPVSTLSNVNSGAIVNNVASVQSSIEYKKVVLQLEVVPLINSEKEVSLDILQKLDSLVPNGNVNISGNSVPTIDTKYIRTNVSAKNGSTIILGGLIQDQKQRNYNGIPYLSRIPLIGAAFRSTVSTKQRQELIILMCPQVTLTKLDSYRLRQRWEDTTHFGADLDQNECPDCPKPEQGKQLTLPPPDIPSPKDMP